MLTAADAAIALLQYAPHMAPVTRKLLSAAIGEPQARRMRVRLKDTPGEQGAWTTANSYGYARREHPEWPEPFDVVRLSLEEMQTTKRVAARRPARAPLTLRAAVPGDAYRTWSYGLVRGYGDERSRVSTEQLQDGSRQHVLLAHEGRRLVGATVIYFVDTRSLEQVDIPEIMGQGAVGPIFYKADYRWGGHAIVMDSMWVAPDRRRSGIAAAMAERVARIGLPAWGEFRDPWFVAFFLHRWPPTKNISRGRYWPLHRNYEEETGWADVHRESAELEVTIWLSADHFGELTGWEPAEAAELADIVLDDDEDVRRSPTYGGWDLRVDDATITQADGGWLLTVQAIVDYEPGALLARAAIDRHLAHPFGRVQHVDTLEQALDATLIAQLNTRAQHADLHVVAWALDGEPSTTGGAL